jgi:hypothetical protein
MKKLRADSNQGMLVFILCRNFCLPVCYPKHCLGDEIRKTEMDRAYSTYGGEVLTEFWW